MSFFIAIFQGLTVSKFGSDFYSAKKNPINYLKAAPIYKTTNSST